MFRERIPGRQRVALGRPWAADGAVDKPVPVPGDELGWHPAPRAAALLQLRCSLTARVTSGSGIVGVVAAALTCVSAQLKEHDARPPDSRKPEQDSLANLQDKNLNKPGQVNKNSNQKLCNEERETQSIDVPVTEKNVTKRSWFLQHEKITRHTLP